MLVKVRSPRPGSCRPLHQPNDDQRQHDAGRCRHRRDQRAVEQRRRHDRRGVEERSIVLQRQVLPGDGKAPARQQGRAHQDNERQHHADEDHGHAIAKSNPAPPSDVDGARRGRFATDHIEAAAAEHPALQDQAQDREADDRRRCGRRQLEARRIGEQLVDLGGQRVKACAVPDGRRRAERPHRFKEDEHRRREDRRQHQWQGNAHGRPPRRRADHLRRLFVGRVHVVERCGDRKEDERIEAQREHQHQAFHAVDVEQPRDAEGLAQEHVDQAGIGSEQQNPGNHRDEVRDHEGDQHRHAHELPAGHVGARDRPRHRQCEHERQGGRRDADNDRIDQSRDEPRFGQHAPIVSERQRAVFGAQSHLEDDAERIEDQPADDDDGGADDDAAQPFLTQLLRGPWRWRARMDVFRCVLPRAAVLMPRFRGAAHIAVIATGRPPCRTRPPTRSLRRRPSRC